jgi:streptogramin lyase
VVEALESRRLLAVGIQEFTIPTANSAPFWITAGPGAVLDFTAGGTNQIGAYNPAIHGFTSFSIPTATIGSSSYITAGTDGKLYFTASNDNAIEQLNPATHVITAFPIPTAGLGPQFITTGADGNLYFTTSNANVIEQLEPTTPVFIFKTFFIPTANSGASGITSGPDNSLWFIESTANKIGQLNLATHVVREFSIPNAIGGTSTITTGTDGDLYFTEPGPNSIGQFNPITRKFRFLPIPVANSGAADITTGPDGNLYFTEPGANEIGQLNPNEIGQLNPATPLFTELVIPTANSGATGITAGPDGNVYFTETTANKIGEVVISTTTATTTQLTAAPNPSIPGISVTFTATVTAASGTPTGTITFSIDGVAQAPVKLTQFNGQAQASFSTSSLGLGDHTIIATYSGGPGFAPSTSSPVTEAIVNPVLDGPIVLQLQRFGVHDHPTTLVLTFDKPLKPASAQNRRNYRLVNPHGRPGRIVAAVYQPSTLTVTLHLAQRLDIHRVYTLTVVGTPPNGVRDTTGKLLDGAGTGHPGSNFVTDVTIANLVLSSKP